MKTPQEIAALAAELTETEIADICRAKLPANIKGHKITSISLNVNTGSPHTIHMHAGRSACVVSHPTFASAVQAISRELPNDAAEEAAQLRRKAADMIAEANKLTAAEV